MLPTRQIPALTPMTPWARRKLLRRDAWGPRLLRLCKIWLSLHTSQSAYNLALSRGAFRCNDKLGIGPCCKSRDLANLFFFWYVFSVKHPSIGHKPRALKYNASNSYIPNTLLASILLYKIMLLFLKWLIGWKNYTLPKKFGVLA